MTATVIAVFVVVYLGMVLGGLPFVQLDRTGIALLGAIALIGLDALPLEEAARAIHLPTLILLFAFMVVSAQMRLGGFYDRVTAKLVALALPPAQLLGVLMLVIAALSAVFSNDIVCLAVAPVLIDACRERRLDPVPFLLGLACAANIGSAATLIGNPQNMLIGQKLQLSFAGYIAAAWLPVVLGLAASWALIAWPIRGGDVLVDSTTAAASSERRADAVPFDGWQTVKGLAVVGVLLVVFLFTSWPREQAALVGAGVLLMSRKLHSRKMLGLVDWELLILFIGLFVVNHALQLTPVLPRVVSELGALGFDLDRPGTLFVTTFALSNVVSNVPAVMLLLPFAGQPGAGPLLALVSTLSGNLLIVGSIANIIVVDAAARRNVRISWRRHAAIGVPVTLVTLAITAACLWPRFGV